MLSLLIASPVALQAAEPAQSAKPNFVIIFIDDLGYADIGPFGATKQRRQTSTAWHRRG